MEGILSMLATYSVVGVCYSDSMMQTRQSQQCFKAGGSGQTTPHLTRSAGFGILKKMIVSLVGSKKTTKKKDSLLFFLTLII